MDEDELLECFLEWTMDLGFDLYPAQEEAVLELMAGRHVVLDTPTGSGKSLVAVAMHLRGLARGERSVYTSPIKALVSEKFFALCRDFGAENVGMLTGDASINRDAPILCCTAEVLSNMVLRQGGELPFRHVVMDEFHYYADRDRGMAWQVPLLTMSDATFLLMSATLGDTSAIRKRLEDMTGREASVVVSTDRPVPLEFEYRDTTIHNTIADLVGSGRAPVYLVCFSQRAASDQAQNLMSVNFSSKEDKKAIANEIKGFRFDSPYGPVMRRYLGHGIGLHHAGLLPKYRLLVEKLSQKGLLKVIAGTDTLGVGVNIPIRTVLLSQLCKFDGENTRILSVREFRQISGRAGRKGFDEQGWVASQAPEHVVENKRMAAKLSTAGKKKKFVSRKPPQRGYVPWDKKTFERLCTRPCEPLTSVFSVNHGVLLNVLQRPTTLDQKGGGYRALIELIEISHESINRKKRLRRETSRLFQSLLEAGIVELQSNEGRSGQSVVVSESLQRDFSLHQSLSLFLIHAIDRLDQESETYPLDLLTLVESILEHPRPVLASQVNKLKGQLVAELKAAGVPYEERMEKLEDVTWPKPNEDWIYAQFDHFRDTRPWVEHENIRIKSVARDMFERFMSINDYVREYGLERMEGLLLRYLSQTYKALVQIVPDFFKTEDVVDMSAFLRAALARVDSSLVQEWESMLGGPTDPTVEEQPQPPRPHVTADMKSFTARIRAELHRLVKALAERDYQEASLCIRQNPDDPWTAERFEEALADFHSTYGDLVFNHHARLSDKTFIEKIGFRQFEVSQVLVDQQDDNYWAIDALIDLADEEEVSDEPLFLVRQIGV